MEERELCTFCICCVEPNLSSQQFDYLSADLKSESSALFELIEFYESSEYLFRLFLFYAAFWHRASSFRNAASMSEKRSVRLNFSDTFPGMACSSSIYAHSSGWWS